MVPRRFRFMVLFLLACLTLSSLARADKTTDFSDSGGTIPRSNAGLSVRLHPGVGNLLFRHSGDGRPWDGYFLYWCSYQGSLQMGGTLAGGGEFSRSTGTGQTESLMEFFSPDHSRGQWPGSYHPGQRHTTTH
jgi:hypothetical protein